MDIRPIRTEADYQAALGQVAAYFDEPPPVGSADGDRFEVLVTLLEAYEGKHFPIRDADPVEILEFAIQDMGRSQAELAAILGSRSRATEILNRKRALTIGMIDKISREWRIPVAALARPYRIDRKNAPTAPTAA